MTGAATRTRWWHALGPGIVFVLTVVGPGDLVSNVAAGASHGYALLWVLGVALTFRYVWLSTSARYVLVTGESLVAGFARYGRIPLWLTLGALVVIRHMSNLTKVLLLGGAVHLVLPLPLLPAQRSIAVWSALLTFAGYLVMARGGYGWIERLCKALAVLLGALLIVAAIAVRPSVSGIARGFLVPTAPPDVGAYSTMLLLAALIGTESGSLTNVTYSYFVLEKGWRDMGARRQQRIDLVVGVLGLLLAGALLQIVAAGTLFGTGAEVRSVEDLSRLFSSRLGLVGRTVFALGLLAKVFAGFVGATTGYALIASDVCARLGVPRGHAPGGDGDRRTDRVFRFAIAFWSFSPLYVLFTTWTPVFLGLLASLALAVFIPLLAVGLLVLANDRQRLGAHVNGWWANTLIVALAVLSVYVIGANVVGFLGSAPAPP